MWAHKPWHGRYLPDGLTRDDQLSAYASWCNAVEGNTTFYGLPSGSTVASWAAQAPAGFRFMFKLPRTITHERRLRDASDELQEFIRLIEPLGDRVEPFGPGQLGDLARFLHRLPESHRFAVEVRHGSFFDGSARQGTLERLLRDRGVEWISFDTATLFAAPPTSEAERDGWQKKPRVPVRLTPITDRPVIRFIGRDDVAATEAGWQYLLPVVARWLLEGRTPTVFLHTPDNTESLLLARRFHDQVRALVPALDPLPEPIRPAPTTLF